MMPDIKRYIIYFLFAVLPLMVLSCTAGSCFDETEAYVKASFYNNTARKLQAPDSVSLYGLNMSDNKIYDKTTGLQPAHIPLNNSSDTCRFVITINGIADTLEFRYISYPHLISKECGVSFYHQLDTVLHTKHTIDFIYLSRKTITNVNEENIRIFY